MFVADEPWEGNTSGYYSYFQDGDLYRMVYRGWQHNEKKRAVHKEVTCYAESKDGIHWAKPNLGLFEWEGSKENNIVWLTPGTHNFYRFPRRQPGCAGRGTLQGLRRRRWRIAGVSITGLHSLEADPNQASHHQRRLRLAESRVLGHRTPRVPRVLALLHQRHHHGKEMANRRASARSVLRLQRTSSFGKTKRI